VHVGSKPGEHFAAGLVNVEGLSTSIKYLKRHALVTLGRIRCKMKRN
jgi:hypothetical protein